MKTADEAEKFLNKEYDVPRGTFLQLEVYVNLLLKWNKSINLISKNTEKDVWLRHIVDSAQLINHIKPTEILADIGSGSGLPGMVLSILGIKHTHLIDSDMRKCLFLQEAKKISKNKVEIHNCLYQDAIFARIDVITARAFCKIDELLRYTDNSTKDGARIVILKGKTWQVEVDLALREWSFEYEYFPSVTDSSGAILVISKIERRIND